MAENLDTAGYLLRQGDGRPAGAEIFERGE
jgi:hypothetical protein